VIKVFVQVELGRYSVISGKGTLTALSEVPGPRIHRRGNWIVWYWFLMFIAVQGQAGGIVGSVGQSLAISLPLTEDGQRFNQIVSSETQLQLKHATLKRLNGHNLGTREPTEVRTQLTAEIAELRTQIESYGDKPETIYDDRLWAAALAVITSILLGIGRYGLIQAFATTLVLSFTLVTVGNVIALQGQPDWAVSGAEIARGLSFQFPPATKDLSPLATALATFGIIGVGASELVGYPYWCLEKGYARFVGPRDESSDWAERARGWMRVMRFDAWAAMVLYTFATIAFYLLGAAVLHRSGLNPAGPDMIRTLAVMYEPVFGVVAESMFLFGAFAVLYSTYFVGAASHSRVLADSLRVLHVVPKDDASYRRWVRRFSMLLPFVALSAYLFYPRPAVLVLISGVMQAMMLPMLAVAALYFRHRRGDPRLKTTTLWDTLLWISAIGMVIAGLWAAWERIRP